jgi:uncharacterized membrane protein
MVVIGFMMLISGILLHVQKADAENRQSKFVSLGISVIGLLMILTYFARRFL